MNEEQALASVSGEYGSPPKRRDLFRVTVYGLDEPVLYNGRWEFRHFVCRIEWLTGSNGPGKDRAVLGRELPDLGYAIVRGPEPLDDKTSECVVRPIFKR